MIESDLAGCGGSETVASFQREFDLGVEALNDTAGIQFFGVEIVH